jgi:hypothetical protein
MKSRPRRIENQVASQLSTFYREHGLPAVQRVPVIGRTGPDLSVSGDIAVDVKSRLKVPKGFVIEPGNVMQFDGMIGARLGELDLLLDLDHFVRQGQTSKQVRGWLDHMGEWVTRELPGGIPALVLHRPGMWVEHAGFIINLSDRRKLYDKCNGIRLPSG